MNYEDISKHANSDGLSFGQPDKHERLQIQTTPPTFELENLKVEWKALPAELMNEIIEIPFHTYIANKSIDNDSEYSGPPDYGHSFENRQYRYADLGIDAYVLAKRLRAFAGLPARKPLDWNPVEFMEDAKHSIEKERREREAYFEKQNELLPPGPTPSK